jgi:hypothetical protein
VPSPVRLSGHTGLSVWGSECLLGARCEVGFRGRACSRAIGSRVSSSRSVRGACSRVPSAVRANPLPSRGIGRGSVQVVRPGGICSTLHCPPDQTDTLRQ